MKSKYISNRIIFIFIFIFILAELVSFIENPAIRYFTIFLPIIIFSIYATYRTLCTLVLLKKRKIPKIIFIILIIIFTFFLVNIGLIRFDIERIIEVCSYYLPLLGVYFISKKYPINNESFTIIIMLIILPMFVINSFMIEGYRMSLFHLYEDGRRLFYFNSIHEFGILEVAILAFLLNNYLYTRKNIILIMSLFLTVLIFYSGSRVSLVIALTLYASLLFFRIENKNIKRFFLYLLPLIILFTLYSIDFFKIYLVQLNLFQDQLKLDRANLTPSRMWLWLYHIKLFMDNLWTGVSSTYVDLRLGDFTVDGEYVKAGSESYFTKVIARDGLWGIIHIAFIYYMLVLAVRIQSFNSYSLLVIVFFGMAFLGKFTDLNNILVVVIYWSYFSYLKSPKKPKKRSKGRRLKLAGRVHSS